MVNSMLSAAQNVSIKSTRPSFLSLFNKKKKQQERKAILTTMGLGSSNEAREEDMLRRRFKTASTKLNTPIGGDPSMLLRNGQNNLFFRCGFFCQ